MNCSLDVLSFAAAGIRGIELPEDRVCALPPPGLHPRRPRLPGLATELALKILAGRDVPPETSVFLATGLGSSTETEAFVDNMIRNDEATPMPRAFSASVHNAAASRIAIRLKARGASVTFVHAETSLAQAVFAAGCRLRKAPAGPAIVGGADELAPSVRRARSHLGCAVEADAAEGGAVFLVDRPSPERPALARIRSVHLGRLADPGDPAQLRSWLETQVDAEAVDMAFLAPPAGWPTVPEPQAAPAAWIVSRPWTGDHPSSAAAAAALAVGLLCGEVAPESFRRTARPRSIAIASASRFGDAGLVIIQEAS